MISNKNIMIKYNFDQIFATITEIEKYILLKWGINQIIKQFLQMP